ncbi:MAG: nitroreductase family protein, partial [Bacteroidales bacterium]
QIKNPKSILESDICIINQIILKLWFSKLINRNIKFTMTFTELILARQSVRRYANIPVEKEKLDQCLESARLAPSASNSQPWKFIVVDQEPLRAEVAKATFSDIQLINKFTLQAPVMIVIVMEKAKLITRLAMLVKKKEWPLIDIGITAEHFCLQAAELGLGTCMIGWFDEDKIKKLLQIPSDNSIGLVISVGYAVDGYPQRTKIRKPIDEVVRYNKY